MSSFTRSVERDWNDAFEATSVGPAVVGAFSLFCPGTTGYASTPDASVLDITGDIDIRADLTMPDWSPAANMSVVSKYNTSNNQRSYQLQVATSGFIRLLMSADGNSPATSFVSTADISAFVNGTQHSIRVTLDVDNGAGGSTARFYTGDGVESITWTEVGVAVVGSTISIHAGTAMLAVGAESVDSGSPTSLLLARVHAVQVRNGIEGTVVADAAFTDQTFGTTGFTDDAGLAWTVTSPARIVNSEVSLNLPGVAGAFARAPDSAALSVTGDLDMRIDVELDDWTPSVACTLMGKWGVGGTRAYLMQLQPPGLIRIGFSPDNGTNQFAHDSTTTPPGVVSGSRLALRATLAVSTGSGREARFYTAPTIDGPWTQLGNAVTNTTPAVIGDTVAPFDIGGHNNGGAGLYEGKVYAAEMRSGIDGTVVANPNFNVQTRGVGSVTDAAGNTFTVEGTAQIRHSHLSTRGLFSFIGTRFEDIAIVGGGRIDSAYLTFTLAETARATMSGSLRAQDVDSAAIFTATSGDIGNRTPTSVGASWSATGSYAQVVTTPDLSNALQEVIDRPGWVSGNPVVIIYSHGSSTSDLSLAGFGHLTFDAPELTVEWTYVDPNPIVLRRQEMARIDYQETP